MNKPIKYGLFLMLTIAVIIFVISVIFNLLGNSNLLLLFAAIISALIITFIIIITAPILKDFLATYRTMMRLENLSHPLLLQLSLEAPGTYHHSLIVANLANRAAKAIGADSIMTRIGGYYHDIGKSKNPTYFIENQIEGENPHSTLNSPKKSAQIIIKHVLDGVKMAQENHLPREIIDLIEQHHGTTVVSFFYQQAKENKSATGKVRKNDYSYSGPKPLFPEAAILLFADAIEAKIRLCNKVTPLIIRNTVDEVISARIQEKQLELSKLNANKIERIRESFIETLSTMFHQRIQYHNNEKKS